MNTKNILAILGSPHSNGTTAAMLNYAIQAVQTKGYYVTKVNLYQMNISYCIGCRACLINGICIQKDDIQMIVTLLRECHIIILAALVYWANVLAPVKNLFDRLLGTAIEETNTFSKPRLSGKKYIILTSCNTPAPFSWIFGQSTEAIHNMKEFFKTAGLFLIVSYIISTHLPFHHDISFLLWLLFISLLVLVIDYLLKHFISNPISKIYKSAHRIAQLDFSSPCELTSKDEFGDLAKNLNKISENLQYTLEELKNATIKLEKDVAAGEAAFKRKKRTC